MSAKGGSSLGTLLFSVPLAAIPLMAIFGIPQFAPLVASPERTRGYSDQEDAPEYDRRRPGDDRRLDQFEPEFDEDLSTADDHRGRADRSYDDRRESRGGRDERPQQEFAQAWPADRNEPAGQFDDPSATRDLVLEPQLGEATDDAARGAQSNPASAGLSWQTAAERFEAMGINGYHLEQGSAPGTFLFVCSFCTAENPNVTMRFEAEAPEPLDAVGDVLAQIDRWQTRQSGQ